MTIDRNRRSSSLVARLAALALLVLPLSIGTSRLAAQTAAPAAPATPTKESASPAVTLPAGYVPEFGTMWTFDAPPLEYWKARYNFTPDAAWLEHVRLASVRLPNCSASFVSQQGMVMTNHHCARSCISAVSPADTNYQRSGFVARTAQEEKKCEGLYVDQLESIEDVTARVRGAVTSSAASRQIAQRDSAIADIQTKCGTETGLTCQVVTLYQGGLYSLYRYRRYSDLRLVMAPEEEISFFGGDPDNFTFPRYDLDLTLLRVYQDDKPFRPQHYLKWSQAGAAEGELVFVTGNPGSTGRLLTMAQMEYLRDVQYPASLATLARNIKTFKALAAESEDAKRKYENQIFGLENSQKAITGYRAGLLDSALMARKQAFETDFRARVARDPKLKSRYGTAWDAISSAETRMKALAPKARYYGFGGAQSLGLAGVLVRLPQQSALPDSARLAQYKGQGAEQFKMLVLRDQPVDLAADRRTLTTQLEAAARELPKNDPFLVAVLAGRTPAAAAEAILADTKIGDLAVRKELLDGGAKAVAASTDPLIVLARKIAPLANDVVLRVAKEDATIAANAEKIGQAIFAAYGTSLPPDATFSLRISDGVVKGYPMNGTMAPYKTSFYGLYARSAEFGDKAPFQLPSRWRERQSKLDMSAPFDFVSTNDIIGGNSGSPVINKNGEVVGLIFDSNIEGLGNRFIFTDDVARSVSVHSAGISAALRGIYDAARIADELEGRPTS